MLLTRAPLYSFSEENFPVRLACVKHAASVRSEPGSNSSVQSIKKLTQKPLRFLLVMLETAVQLILFSFQRSITLAPHNSTICGEGTDNLSCCDSFVKIFFRIQRSNQFPLPRFPSVKGERLIRSLTAFVKLFISKKTLQQYSFVIEHFAAPAPIWSTSTRRRRYIHSPFFFVKRFIYKILKQPRQKSAKKAIYIIVKGWGTNLDFPLQIFFKICSLPRHKPESSRCL